jgi:exo beta-1,2-glucooligosaccharide sophorohydrolase (non-reducing end)
MGPIVRCPNPSGCCQRSQRIAILALLLLGNRGALAIPPSEHGAHVFFETSAADRSYFFSEATVVAPSALEVIEGKVPVESRRFYSPPNCLRLKWSSGAGGDWHVTLKAPERYIREPRFDGDTLSIWCFSEQDIAPDEGPRVFLQDETGAGVPTIVLLARHGRLEAGKWTEVQLPFATFAGQYEGTDDRKFDSRRLSKITFVQHLEDRKEHVLYLDDIYVIDSKRTQRAAPPSPTGLTVTGKDRHFDISWQPSHKAPSPRTSSRGGESEDVLSYRIYRSVDGGAYEPIGMRPGWSCRYIDFINAADKKAQYKVSALSVTQSESPLSEAVGGTTRTFSDDELLDMVQEGCFRYYWEAANPQSGMAVEIVPGDENLVAVGASGFGIMAQLVATDRKFITREESAQRMLKIVRFLGRADRFHGAWPHFLDGRTGRVNPYFGKYDDGGDLVETAFLVQGLLAARQYFNRDYEAEREIRDMITALWRGVEWDWYRKSSGSDVLYWHWSPDHSWHISHPLIGWNETMIVYLLAIGSPTHPVPPAMYYSGWAGQSDAAVQYRRTWSRTTDGDHYTNGKSYYGKRLDVGSGTGGDLFFTQFSFLGFDPRNKRDRFTNYFRNNRNIALINRAYCIENPRKYAGYGPNCWGLSAGVNSGGGRPLARDDNGTICTSAALGVFPYTPKESMAALKHFYRDLGAKLWGTYGFHDGFNQSQDWFEEVYMGLNQAQIVVGIENHRSGMVWTSFMANTEIESALRSIGFQVD